ncbi:MAG: galactose-1-phosphate uridylyltransferase, partial [Eubacteriales bacterium]|nr:galactose-1-phosphate uridylyltransferase [Eubacteriales bacterium]
DIRADERIAKHADWAEELQSKYTFTVDNAMDILQKEVGVVFAKVLEHAGVYPRTEAGKQAFLRFLASV